MFIVLFLAILAFIPVGVQLSQIASRKSKMEQHVVVQADNVARAGLMDALSWFRRQTTQPVAQGLLPYADAAFSPISTGDANSSDTDDKSVGLVREYQLGQDNDAIWARYEVPRQTSSAYGPYNAYAVHDITQSRVQGGTNGQGLAWSLTSTGYVYYRVDGSKAFNVSPNRILAKTRATTEIRRISISLPANCSTIVNSRSTVNLSNQSKINGNGTIGLGYYSGASAPTTSGGSTITGSPATANITGTYTSINVQGLFGVTEQELRVMADVSVSTLSELTTSYPSMAVVFVNGNATFDGTHQLRGGGILYIRGNLTITSNSNTFFSGIVFVTGNVTINGPASLSGALVVQGTVTMNGNGDVVDVVYDSGILTSVNQQVAQYRENKSTYFISGLQ